MDLQLKGRNALVTGASMGIGRAIAKGLAAEGVNIEMIATSEIKVSVVVNSKYGELAMRALHDAFLGEGANSLPGETV